MNTKNVTKLPFLVFTVCLLSTSDALRCVSCGDCQSGDVKVITCEPPADKACAKNIVKHNGQSVANIIRGCANTEFDGDRYEDCSKKSDPRMRSEPLCLYLCKTDECNSASILPIERITLLSTIIVSLLSWLSGFPYSSSS